MSGTKPSLPPTEAEAEAAPALKPTSASASASVSISNESSAELISGSGMLPLSPGSAGPGLSLPSQRFSPLSKTLVEEEEAVAPSAGVSNKPFSACTPTAEAPAAAALKLISTSTSASISVSVSNPKLSGKPVSLPLPGVVCLGLVVFSGVSFSAIEVIPLVSPPGILEVEPSSVVVDSAVASPEVELFAVVEVTGSPSSISAIAPVLLSTSTMELLAKSTEPSKRSRSRSTSSFCLVCSPRSN